MLTLKYTELYTVLNPKTCTINNKQSSVTYEHPGTCFNLYKAIVMDDVNK
jgi:hypothetical protein